MAAKERRRKSTSQSNVPTGQSTRGFVSLSARGCANLSKRTERGDGDKEKERGKEDGEARREEEGGGEVRGGGGYK
eukprot:1465714-Rhodomonas_salina.1